MCGIAGMIDGNAAPRERLAAAAHLLRHRGPDASGVWTGQLGRQQAALVHTRLSIIDLDPRANQPFLWDDCILSFNGEIYNYLELRRELEVLGHKFVTQSDTEVVVHAWRQWDAACFDKFEGMWALALADTRAGKLVLSRDRFGEKPLYLWQAEGRLLFASEIKAMAALAGGWPDHDIDQLRRFLVNGYKATYKQHSTFYRGVEELPAGSYLLVDCAAGKPLPHRGAAQRYWSLAYAPKKMTQAEMAAGVRERLARAVELRLRADVPVAFCLSGGVDSGALASFAAKALKREVHAFSILDADERYDELRNIRATAADIGCRLHTVHTGKVGFLDRLARQTRDRDAPVATISYYCTISFRRRSPRRAIVWRFRVPRPTNCSAAITTTTPSGWRKWLTAPTCRA